MSGNVEKKRTLSAQDIVTEKRLNRRSLLVSLGLGAAVGTLATVVAGTRKAFAGDQKEGDMQDRNPPKIDGSRDTD